MLIYKFYKYPFLILYQANNKNVDHNEVKDNLLAAH